MGQRGQLQLSISCLGRHGQLAQLLIVNADLACSNGALSPACKGYKAS